MARTHRRSAEPSGKTDGRRDAAATVPFNPDATNTTWAGYTDGPEEQQAAAANQTDRQTDETESCSLLALSLTMASLPPAFTSLVTPLTLRLRDIVSFQLPRLSASSSGSGKRSQGSLSAINLASHEQELNDALQECNGLLQKLQLVHEELVDDLELQGNGLDNVLTAELQRLTKQYAE